MTFFEKICRDGTTNHKQFKKVFVDFSGICIKRYNSAEIDLNQLKIPKLAKISNSPKELPKLFINTRNTDKKRITIKQLESNAKISENYKKIYNLKCTKIKNIHEKFIH